MLTLHRHHPTPDEAALLAVVQAWRRFDWDRALLASCVAFHLILAVVLAIAPYDLVLTEGTRPVLDIASRYVWATVFLAVAAAVGSLHWMRSRLVHLAAWTAVTFLGGMWVTAFALAVLQGRGSAVGVVVWPFLYGPWVVVAFRSLGKR